MSRKCHRCGVQALEGQTFAVERYPLLGERGAYCPGCHRRFLTRLEILSFGFWIIVAVVAAIRSQQRGGSPWNPLLVQFTLLLGLAWLVTHQRDLDRVEERLSEYLQSSTQRRNQIEVLDQHIICDLLRRGIAAASPHAERWARRALELAPGTPTLLGTLGGVLAERGREAEAEPLLQPCLRESVQLHDQAMAALFLGGADGPQRRPESGEATASAGHFAATTSLATSAGGSRTGGTCEGFVMTTRKGNFGASSPSIDS